MKNQQNEPTKIIKQPLFFEGFLIYIQIGLNHSTPTNQSGP